jgi:uncharacterized integral membrane protein
MKFKIFIVVIAITLEALFAGLNMNNSSDISFGFTTLTDVPVFLSISISFVAGALIILPFTLFRGRKKTKEQQPVKKKKISLKKSDKNIEKKDIEKDPFDM